MTTPDDLRAMASQVTPPNDEILVRAAHYLDHDDRYGVETAHNLVCDVISNYGVLGQIAPAAVTGAEHDLRQERISRYGAVGRPVGTASPNLRGGW